MWFYVNGAYVPEEDAKVSVTDRAFLYGDGCFEGLGVFRGRIPHLDAHIDRFYRSARMLRIEVPLKAEELREVILRTAALNRMSEVESGYLRPLLTRGPGPLGIKNSFNVGPPTLVVIPQLSGRTAMFGESIELLTAAITNYVRPGSPTLDPAIKSNNYLTSVLAYMEASSGGQEVDVAILRDHNGHLAEGHAMNLFCIVGDRVLTPTPVAALRGITREYVIAISRDLGLEVRETSLNDYDLICADEAFVTSAMESVAPLRSVNGRPMPDPVPGPVTTRIRRSYLEFAWASATEIPAEA